ncbi:MAG: hypothetical protein IJK07_05395 [Bacteroidales bacterium]|nr:hypothetical protein [Bacteroidales bacterium]
MGLEKYDIKILLALTKCIAGRKDFFHWLMNNGYPELAAFSNAIRGDIDAMKWLFANNYAWLAILSNAIDGEDKARVWIGKATHICNLMFAMACREDIDAIKWLDAHGLGVFLMMAKETAQVLETQALENTGPYVLHFNQM